MIRAVLLVAAVLVVLTACIIIAVYFNKAQAINDVKRRLDNKLRKK